MKQETKDKKKSHLVALKDEPAGNGGLMEKLKVPFVMRPPCLAILSEVRVTE
jgi:hypothetical protein